MKKRISSIFLALCMVLAMLPMSVFEVKASADIVYSNLGQDGDGSAMSATLTPEGVFTIAGTGSMREYSISTRPWQAELDNIKKVVIEEGITNICEFAFSNCGNLTNVSFPESLKVIPTEAFNNANIDSVVIPVNVESIEAEAFSNCDLSKVTFAPGSKLKTFSRHASFSDNPRLTSIEIPDGVDTIGTRCFENTGLSDVVLPPKLTEVSISSFSGCPALRSVVIPAEVIGVQSGAFSTGNAVVSEKLESLTFLGSVPPIMIGSKLFSTVQGAVPPNLKVYVPIGSKDAYDDAFEGKGYRALKAAIIEALTFEDSIDYDIPASQLGKEIAPIDVSAGAQGGTAPYSFDADGLPAGISISEAGIISGTPAQVQSSGEAAIIVHDSAGQSASITIAYGSVSPKPLIYTINFDSNGGTVSPSSAITGADGKLSSLPVPVLKGSRFDGWFTEAKGGEQVSTDTVFMQNTTIYAHWAAQEQRPSIVEGDNSKWIQGSNTPLVFRSSANFKDFTGVAVNGKILDAKNYNAKEGSIIVELKPEYLATLAAGTYKISINATSGNAEANFSIEKKGAAAQYTITFEANGGTVSPASAMTGADGKLSSLPVPVLKGSRFDGWFTEAKGGTLVTTAAVFTKNTTIYAHWTVNGTSVPGADGTSVPGADGSTPKAGGAAPKTGDSTSVGLFSLLALVSLAGAAGVIRKRKGTCKR